MSPIKVRFRSASSGVSLPANLNVIGHGAGNARPVATKFFAISREMHH